MNIHFDETNLLASAVGSEHGLDAAEVRKAEPAALAALDAFHKSIDRGDYGFPHLPFDATMIRAATGYAAKAQGSYDTVCVVGIGGSALGAWALDCGLRGPHPIQGAFSTTNPRLVILDNVDPSFVMGALASMNPRKTRVAVIAKSGETAETVSTFLIVRDWLEQALGKRAPERIVAVTSESKGDLKPLATRHGYHTFHLPDNVGGRFSVLSAVGLVPGALAGFDIAKVCKGAAAMTRSCWSGDLKVNTALRSALHHWLLLTGKNKPIQVAFPYCNRLWGAAFWFRQLWAESLGKKVDRQGNVVHVGQTPVAALGTTDQHSQVQLYMEGPNDKVHSFWTARRFTDNGRVPAAKTGFPSMDYLCGKTLAKLLDAEQEATAAALARESRPNCRYALDRIDAEHLGAFLQLHMFQTAFMGELMNIDAFNQPGVQLGKDLTYQKMGRRGY
jgi:glucose-6-phosphate isomerase